MIENEQDFVNAIINYKPPFYKHSIVNRNKEYGASDIKKAFSVYRRAEEDTRELVSTLALTVNSYSISFDEIIETIKANKRGYTNLVRFAYLWVEALSNADETWIDDRNKASVWTCRSIANEIRNSSTSELLKNGYFPELDRAVLNMHKTNVQSATNLLLRVLYMKDNIARKILNERFPNGNIYFSMI